MGFKKTLLGKFLRGAAKSKIVRSALRSVPIVGTAIGAYEIAQGVGDVLSGPKVPALPAPTGIGGGRMSLPMPQPQRAGGLSGLIPGFRGPGGRLQLPTSDPRPQINPQDVLGRVVLDDSYLKVYYRAPKGYVVVRDPKGRPFPMLRSVAIKYKLWSPSKKPPISVTEWQSFKRSERVVKKLDRIAKSNLNMAKKRKVSCR